MAGRLRRWIKRGLLGVALVVGAAILAGFVYEQIERRQDLKRVPQVGKSIDIGGRALNLYCSGEGSPTVIFESGGGAPGYTWINIQPQVAQFTRACWYDRAGYGWSDPGSQPRTSAAIVSDLHALLGAAGVAPPYVLVGASFGGFPVRVFAGRYPGEVSGIVLVDASHEDQHEPDSMKAPANRLPPSVHNVLCALLPAAGEVGLIRLTMKLSGSGPAPAGMTSEQSRNLELLSQQPKTVASNEGCHWDESAAQARSAGTFGNRPLIVLTAGREFIPPDPQGAKEANAFHDKWVKELQPALARLSSHGRQLIVENSGHGIQFEAPDVIVSAIREVINEIQSAKN
jgi:pimeloyl-ACP methyl ester carboxylesterase